jgi:hypothetical protein
MFRFMSRNIPQTLGQDACARLSRRTTASAVIAGAAAIALLASANTFANAAENPSRVAQEHHACAVVLGLDPSGRRYRTCISSLDRSLSEWDQVHWRRANEAHVPRRGSAPVRQLSQSAS